MFCALAKWIVVSQNERASEWASGRVGEWVTSTMKTIQRETYSPLIIWLMKILSCHFLCVFYHNDTISLVERSCCARRAETKIKNPVVVKKRQLAIEFMLRLSSAYLSLSWIMGKVRYDMNYWWLIHMINVHDRQSSKPTSISFSLSIVRFRKVFFDEKLQFIA